MCEPVCGRRLSCFRVSNKTRPVRDSEQQENFAFILHANFLSFQNDNLLFRPPSPYPKSFLPRIKWHRSSWQRKLNVCVGALSPLAYARASARQHVLDYWGLHSLYFVTICYRKSALNQTICTHGLGSLCSHGALPKIRKKKASVKEASLESVTIPRVKDQQVESRRQQYI